MRLPLHRGEFKGTSVWYILTDASTHGAADELNLNFAPKLDDAAIGRATCVQEVTLKPDPKDASSVASVQVEGVPDFSPTRVLKPGPTGFPPVAAEPGAVGDAKYSPLMRVAGSTTVCNAPIVAAGDRRAQRSGKASLRHGTRT